MALVAARYPDLVITNDKIDDQDRLFISEDQYKAIKPALKAQYADVSATNDKIDDQDRLFISEEQYKTVKNPSAADVDLNALLWKLYGQRSQ